MLSTEDAEALVRRHLGDTPRAVHTRAVARPMRRLAGHFSADGALWEAVGLCHDLDFLVTAGDRTQHGLLAVAWLGDSLPEEARQAIAAHDHRTGVEADTLLADTLKAADTAVAIDQRLGRPVWTKMDRGDPYAGLRARLGERAYLADILERHATCHGLAFAGIAGFMAGQRCEPAGSRPDPLYNDAHVWYVGVMTDLPKHKMTADEFLAWAEDLPDEAGKFELWDGEVVLRHGPGGFEERARHWDAKGAMFAALREAIVRAGLPCRAAVDGPMVRLSPSKMARPDVLVYCGPGPHPDAQEVPNPVVVVEVLSPTTKRRDHGVKLQGYFTLPSIHHYLIVDRDRRRLVHHERGAGGAVAPRFVTGPRLRLDPPGLDVDLTEVLGI
jgi:Uma2 family endonuclease